MKALTLWRPWSDAIVHGPKRVENRPWPPHAGTLGTLIAIHAGQKYGLGDWTLPEGYVAPDAGSSPTGIVGVARVAGYLDLRKGSERRRSETMQFARLAARVHCLDEDLWWIGPVGWLLEDVIALPKPIPCRGALGLWRVPPEIVDQITEALS